MRTPLVDNDVVIMNTLYKERFPKVSSPFCSDECCFEGDLLRMHIYSSSCCPDVLYVVSLTVVTPRMSLLPEARLWWGIINRRGAGCFRPTLRCHCGGPELMTS